MNNLTLVTTEKFNNSIECNFYKNNDNEILLTRKQIGIALGYKHPDIAISNIHSRHKSRLDKFSVLSNLSSTDGKTYETILYSRKGVMEICRHSNKSKANEFMDWVWDIVDKYIRGEIIDKKEIQNLFYKLTEATTQGFQNMNKNMIDCFNSLDQRISKLENNATTKVLPKKLRFTYWQSKMFPKYQALAEYFEIQLRDLYKNLYREFQNMYPDIELNQIVDDYCYENKLETCYTLDAIEHNKTVRVLFEQLVDTLLEKYDLVLHKEKLEVSTIFDTK